jgi:hypothetical protein
MAASLLCIDVGVPAQAQVQLVQLVQYVSVCRLTCVPSHAALKQSVSAL